MKRVLRALAALALAGSLLFSVPGALGFGDFDSGSDFGSDWGGGSDWDSGSNWDSGSDWGGGWDSGWDSGDGGLSSGSGTMVEYVLMLVIVGAILIYLARERRAARSAEEAARHVQSAQSGLKAMEDFYERHPEAGGGEALEAFVTSLYADMQRGWEEGSIENVRSRFTPDPWHRFNSQLEAKKARGETAHVRDIVLKRIDPAGWRETPGGEAVEVEFDAYNTIWTCDREGRIISGTPTRRLLQHFRWTLVWSEGAGETTVSCPNCGHESDASAFAVCPFCGTELKGPGGGWLLQDIEALSQTTLHR